MTPFINPDESFHTGAQKILEHIRAEGLKVQVKNGVLYIGPRDRIDDDLRWLITDYKPELIGLVVTEDLEIGWRVGSMLRQLAPVSLSSPVPFLIALAGCEPNPEDCPSCGELKATGEGDSFICGACSRAKDIALTLWMQRPVQSERAA